MKKTILLLLAGLLLIGGGDYLGATDPNEDEVIKRDKFGTYVDGYLNENGKVRNARGNNDGSSSATNPDAVGVPSVETLSIFADFNDPAVAEVDILAAAADTRYKIVDVTVVCWGGAVLGTIHWGDAQSTTNVIKPLAPGDTGGLLGNVQEQGVITATNTKIRLNVIAKTGTPRLFVVIWYKPIDVS